MYKKLTDEAYKEVWIKKHPLRRKTIPTTIFDDKEIIEEEPEKFTPVKCKHLHEQKRKIWILIKKK